MKHSTKRILGTIGSLLLLVPVVSLAFDLEEHSREEQSKRKSSTSS